MVMFCTVHAEAFPVSGSEINGKRQPGSANERPD
jgi:hypothetical protein